MGNPDGANFKHSELLTFPPHPRFMASIRHIFLLLTAIMVMTSQAKTFETLTFVKTDGSKVSFAVDGLKITYDDFAHVVISNDETSSTLNLAELECMYFGDSEQGGFATGDVNGDGEVNVADVNSLNDIVLGGKTDEATFKRADVNSDGEVNLADINALINIILS
jgi:hypothetical protein